ncbi:MAG: hypothetical protein KAS32_11080 [Candidatus Peribacteraceae bacterium]|nr:hypothetical protein [Candidatus Peribacteraceae bacterium]
MKRIVIAVLMVALLVVPVFAQKEGAATTIVIDTADLTPEQVAKIQETVKVAADNVLIKNMEQISKASEIGQQVGVAIKESLVAVTDVAGDFSETPVGKITMGAVLFKLLGKEAAFLIEMFIGYVVGIAMIIIGTAIFIWLSRRMCIIKDINIEYHENGKKKRKTIVAQDGTNGDIQATRLILGLCWGVYYLVCLAIIFSNGIG